MSPVEELQAAAKKLRELAEATARPHHPYGDPDMELVETTEQWSAEVREYLGGDMGEYCASMHPGVALALADWLDGAASREEAYLASGGGMEMTAGDEAYAALTIARAVLGRGGEHR